MEGPNNCVLFVDDEEKILSALKRGLSREKYLKFFAQSGEDALKIMEKEKIDVLVTDMRMPGMDGLELLKIIKEKYPKTIKIVLSGYTQLPQILATINQVEIFKFITKPWDMESDFKKTINDAIDFFNVKNENILLKESLEKKNFLYQKLLKENNEKIINMRRDYYNIAKLVKLHNDILIDSFEKNKINYDYTEEDIKIYKIGMDIINDYILNLPTIFKNFSIDEIENEIKEFIFKTEDLTEDFKDKEFFKYKNITKVMYRGDFSLLTKIIKLFLKYYISRGNMKNMQIVINAEESGEYDEFIFMISINNKYLAISDTLLKKLTQIFNELVKILGGEMKSTSINDSNVISLKINLKKLI